MTSPNADLILRGGTVFTADRSRSFAEAVSLRNGEILAVGTDSEIEATAGPKTELIDLHGRLLIPGFQDAHLHAVGGGLDLIGLDLRTSDTAAAKKAAVRRYLDRNPGLSWIRGWGIPVAGPESPGELGLPGIGRPAVIFDQSGFRAAVNSAAIRAAGLEPRSDNGEAIEGARLKAVRAAIPPTSDEELHRGLMAAEQHLLALGVTAWQDAGLGAWKMGDDIYEIGQDTYDVHVAAGLRGDLTARIAGAIWWDRHSDESQLEQIEARRGTFGRFRCETAKIQQDGIIEERTAALFDPYSDSPGNTGESFVDPELLPGIVAELDRRNFQVHMHGIGDRGITECLDALAFAAEQNGVRDLRHHIAHLQVPTASDIERLRDLSVTANMQPLWAMRSREMTTESFPALGPTRAAGQYPMGTLHRTGVKLAFGTDWAWTSADPILGIHVAVNRTAPPGYPDVEEADRERPLDPDERIGLADAITAYTHGSAFVNHLDDRTGTIEAGKCADLVVIDRDLFEGPPEEIGAARVDLTLVDGEVVYEAGVEYGNESLEENR